MPANLAIALDFLRELRDHNTKEWFDQNRKRYQHVKSIVEELLTDIITQFGTIDDLGNVTASECMFRINRDVRFSKDKSPYKSSMGLVIGRNGRKTTGRTYYINLEPDGQSFFGGGLYDPSPDQLRLIREHIAEDARDLRTVLNAESFVKHFGTLGGDQLKMMPSGYDKTHPAADLLKYKQFLATHTWQDNELLRDDFVAQVLELSQSIKPFLVLIHKIVDE